MSTRTPLRIGRRSVIIGAAALGFSIGGYTLASAAQSAFFDDNPSQSDLAEVAATDVTTGDTESTIVDDSTLTTIDDSTSSTIDDNGGDDNGSSTSVDDSGNDSDDDDDSTSTTAGSSNPLPAPFTETYNVAGGSITVTWDGAKFHLDAVNAAEGHTPEVETRNDRIKVRFRGDDDSRIEVRISDDDNSLRVKLD